MRVAKQPTRLLVTSQLRSGSEEVHGWLEGPALAEGLAIFLGSPQHRRMQIRQLAINRFRGIEYLRFEPGRRTVWGTKIRSCLVPIWSDGAVGYQNPSPSGEDASLVEQIGFETPQARLLHLF